MWNVFDVMIRRMEIWETKLVGRALGVGNATNCVPLISVIIRSMRGDVKGYNQISVAGYLAVSCLRSTILSMSMSGLFQRASVDAQALLRVGLGNIFH